MLDDPRQQYIADGHPDSDQGCTGKDSCDRTAGTDHDPGSENDQPQKHRPLISQVIPYFGCQQRKKSKPENGKSRQQSGQPVGNTQILTNLANQRTDGGDGRPQIKGNPDHADHEKGCVPF